MNYSNTPTHSQPVCVKRVPTEINHVNGVLDGVEGPVRQSARLRALRTDGTRKLKAGPGSKVPKQFPRSSYLKDGDLAP